MTEIILASASPRRSGLLRQGGIAFQTMTSGEEEKITERDPQAVVEELSRRKALAVSNQIKRQDPGKQDYAVIGADTVVSYRNRIMGKPGDPEDAFEMLKQLQGNIHEVYTGVTLCWRKEAEPFRQTTFSVCTEVSVYPMAEDEIRSYIATGEPMDKAGAYGIQGRFADYVREIRGDYNNVVGLPLGRVYQELRKRELL